MSITAMAQPRNPKKENKGKPQKQTALGYITYLSKSSCQSGGRPQFDIHFQNEEQSVMKAKGFVAKRSAVLGALSVLFRQRGQVLLVWDNLVNEMSGPESEYVKFNF